MPSIKTVAFVLKSVKWYSRFIGMNKSGVLRNSPKSCGRSVTSVYWQEISYINVQVCGTSNCTPQNQQNCTGYRKYMHDFVISTGTGNLLKLFNNLFHSFVISLLVLEISS